MSALRKELGRVWDSLRGKKPHFRDFLEAITISNIRAIEDLTIQFNYPVTVIAGPNATGKSTILFAAACAYKNKNSTTPGLAFPNLSTNNSQYNDSLLGKSKFIRFLVRVNQRSDVMIWRKTNKSWGKSFEGRKNAKQPSRDVYIRTLANLTSASEVRGLLTFGRKGVVNESKLTPVAIRFAKTVLNVQYSDVFRLNQTKKDMLVARVKKNTKDIQYSEFHMSAGERATLRLFHDISKLNGALVLIDEIETGLHPYVQQQFMLELQRLALENEIQFLITTHSPVVIECVPPEGRIFLERTEEGVRSISTYRDIIYRTIYGQTYEKLSILCEDEMAVTIITGVWDVLSEELELSINDVAIGSDSGKSEFKGYAKAFLQTDTIDSVLFVLDGDAQKERKELEALAEEHGRRASVVLLPGMGGPEAWLLSIIPNSYSLLTRALSKTESSLREAMNESQRTYANAVGASENGKAKYVFEEFCRKINFKKEHVARSFIAILVREKHDDVQLLVQDLRRAIESWRASRAL